jgi:heterodisulfide reductase subunit C
MAGRGDLLPHQVLRLLQLGDESAAATLQPWLCVGCQTCATRCPQEIDLSLFMDALRAEARKAGCVPSEARRMAVFNEAFLGQILRRGRLSEIELGIAYNLGTRNPLANADALPALLRRGKVKVGGKVVRTPGIARKAGGETGGHTS